MIADVGRELRALASASENALGYFAAMYAGVTAEIAGSIDAGRFEDGPRMDRFATTFASLYTRCHTSSAPRPQCWQATFDVAGDGHLIILQHLLLGINAHVNHDLPQAVVAIADTTGDLGGVKADFDAINDLLAAIFTAVLAKLDRVSRWANEAGALGGGQLFNFSLHKARDQAWAAAERLFPLSPADRAHEIAEVDRLVSVLSFLITKPGPLGQALVAVARHFEEHDPKRVTAALLGSVR